jgi:hypothetical protein
MTLEQLTQAVFELTVKQTEVATQVGMLMKALWFLVASVIAQAVISVFNAKKNKK